MPLLKISVNTPVSDNQKDAVHAVLSKRMADLMEKPHHLFMVSLECLSISLGGDVAPAAIVELRSIGKINKEENTKYW